MNSITWKFDLWRQNWQLAQCFGYADICEIQLHFNMDTLEKGRSLYTLLAPYVPRISSSIGVSCSFYLTWYQMLCNI